VFNTITTAAALAVTLTSPPTRTPPPSPPARTFEVADVEVSIGTRSAHWATFDADGDQSGEVVVWADADNQIRLDANFADGLSMSALVDPESGELVDLGSDNPHEIAGRLTKISGFLEDEPGITEGRELLCLGSAVLATTCLAGAWIPCVGGSIGVVCNCLPLWEKGYEPPGCGYD
jgi:hypothetical protein